MPPTAPPRGVLASVVAWLATVAVLLAIGLLAGVWTVESVAAHGNSVVPELGTMAFGTWLLVGLPVFLYVRSGLVSPLLVLFASAGYWVVLGVTTPEVGVVRALFVGGLYGWFAVPGFVVLAAVEYALRWLRDGREGPRNGAAT